MKRMCGSPWSRQGLVWRKLSWLGRAFLWNAEWENVGRVDQDQMRALEYQAEETR